MTSRRTLILGVAVLVALLAGLANYAYLRSVDERAYGKARLVRAFILKRDIPKGTPGESAIDQGWIEAENIPQQVRPSTALVSLDEIKGRVAVANLAAKQTLVRGQFVNRQEAEVTFAQRIPAGEVTVTVSVDQVHGVAGLPVPGDRVNVMVSHNGTERYLFQNVKILAVGTTAVPEAGERRAPATPGGGLITFSVPPEVAPKIVFAAEQAGGIYLSLVPRDYKPVDPATTAANAANLLAERRLTPYDSAPPAAGAPR